MKWLTLLFAVLGLACSQESIVIDLEDPPASSVPIIISGVYHYCYSGVPGTNIQVFHFDSPTASDQIVRDPSQNWIDGYFKTQIENKQFYNVISFPDDTVAVRLFIPGTDSTRVRQAFISETAILKSIGPGSYSAGYLYPPGEELPISWNFVDDLGVRVSPAWYAFCTEFVEEDRAIMFWFRLTEEMSGGR